MSTAHKWDVIAAELVDTRQGQRLRGRGTAHPCPYCGTMTARSGGTCYAHKDLPSLDPHTNKRARKRTTDAA